jgi:nicotinamidase-related amidase
VLGNIQTLIDQARAHAIPIMYLQHTGAQNTLFAEGSAGWQIHPSISPHENDSIIEKQKADAFQGTALEHLLNQLLVRSLVVCGFVTEGCVDTTVRRAASLGFNVELASDAHSTTDGAVLKASQIIDHHNHVLAIFAQVKESGEIAFDA